MTTEPSRAAPRFKVPARVVARLVAYYTLCWTVVAVVATQAIPFGGWIAGALALYTCGALTVFLRHRGWPFYPGAAFRVLVVRVFLYTQIALPFVTVAAALGMLIGLPFGRSFGVAKIVGGATLGIILLVFLTGYVGARKLRIARLTLRIPSLPAAFEGTTIAQMCDLHIGPHTSTAFLGRVARTITSLEPDLIVVPGDLVDDRPEDVPLYARAFSPLSAPLGIFISPGNHDIYQGWDAISSALRAANVGTLLVNESRLISRDGQSIAIAGVGDPAGRAVGNASVAPNVDRALSDIPRGVTTIALAHNPQLWPLLVERGVALTLSGHTHGGQFAVPRFGWSLASQFLELSLGHYRRGNSQLYISPGTGHWGIPFRIGVIGEVSFITLTAMPSP